MATPKLAAALLFVCTGLLSAQSPPQSPASQPSQKSQEKTPETCTVSGRVVSAAEGAPIRSARVGLIDDEVKRHPPVYATTTDSDGRFAIKKVPPGRYRFTASRAGFVPQQYQAKATGKGAVVSLSPGQVIDDAMFRLTRAAVVTGRIVDEAGEPMMNVLVSALRKPTAEEIEESIHHREHEKLTEAGMAMTDDRGDYRIFGLKPGEYVVKAVESMDFNLAVSLGVVDIESGEFELNHEVASHYAPLYYPGALQPSEAQPLLLQAGEEASAEITMRRIKTVEVSGHVIDADGKPATHAFVNVYTPDTNFDFDLNGSTDSKGEFVVKGVPPGSYIISAQQHAEGRMARARQKLEVGESNIDSVMLSFGTGITVSGRVAANGAGAAVDRLHIMLESVDEYESGGWSEVKPDGSFEIPNVSDGNYAVHVYGLEKSWYVQSLRMGASDVLQKGLQVERDSAVSKLEILISSSAAQVEGAVTQDNKAVIGAAIRVRPEPETPYNRERLRSAETDQNGHFSIQTMPPGKYKVIAKLPSGTPDVPALASDPQTITLGERDHQTLRFELPKPKEE